MTEKKNEILEAIGKELPRMTESEKTYLMGFLEGFAAVVGAASLTAEQDSA